MAFFIEIANLNIHYRAFCLAAILEDVFLGGSYSTASLCEAALHFYKLHRVMDDDVQLTR